MKIMEKVTKMFTNIKGFLLCLISGSCKYSIKKFLTYVFAALAIYLAVFTMKIDFFYATIGLIPVLLGIRSYDKRQKLKVNQNNGAVAPKPAENNENIENEEII